MWHFIFPWVIICTRLSWGKNMPHTGFDPGKLNERTHNRTFGDGTSGGHYICFTLSPFPIRWGGGEGESFRYTFKGYLDLSLVHTSYECKANFDFKNKQLGRVEMYIHFDVKSVSHVAFALSLIIH